MNKIIVISLMCLMLASCGLELFAPSRTGGADCGNMPIKKQLFIEIDSISLIGETHCSQIFSIDSSISCEFTFKLVSGNQQINVFENLDTNNIKLLIDTESYDSFQRAYRGCDNSPDCISCQDYPGVNEFSKKIISYEKEKRISIALTRNDSIKKSWDVVIRSNLETIPVLLGVDVMNFGIKLRYTESKPPNATSKFYIISPKSKFDFNLAYKRLLQFVPYSTIGISEFSIDTLAMKSLFNFDQLNYSDSAYVGIYLSKAPNICSTAINGKSDSCNFSYRSHVYGIDKSRIIRYKQ